MTKHNKLVRDNIIKIIQEENRTPVYRILNDEDYQKALEEKLFEEVQELITAETHSKKTNEFGDVYEVLEAYANLFEISEIDIQKAKDAKANKNGRFEKKYFLKEVIND